MATILLVNFHEEPGQRIAAFLRMEHYEVRICPSLQSFQKWLRDKGTTTDLLIIDASQNENVVRQLLGEIVSYRAQYGPQPMVICISHVYRGPQFELDLEKKGARVVYV